MANHHIRLAVPTCPISATICCERCLDKRAFLQTTFTNVAEGRVDEMLISYSWMDPMTRGSITNSNTRAFPEYFIK